MNLQCREAGQSQFVTVRRRGYECHSHQLRQMQNKVVSYNTSEDETIFIKMHIIYARK